MKIAITGEQGFLGIHLRNYLKYISKHEVIDLGRDYFTKLSKVKDLDWLIHASSVHRNADNEKVYLLNKELNEKTIDILTENHINCNVVFLSSIQEELNTPYGRSKKEGKELFHKYCLANNTIFISFKLPNVFGVYAIPNKTSFIATFCYNLHNNLPIQFNHNKVKLIYVGELLEIISKFKPSDIPHTSKTVEEVYFLLKNYKENIDQNKFPKINTKFELDLFHTFMSYKNYQL